MILEMNDNQFFQKRTALKQMMDNGLIPDTWNPDPAQLPDCGWWFEKRDAVCRYGLGWTCDM